MGTLLSTFSRFSFISNACNSLRKVGHGKGRVELVIWRISAQWLESLIVHHQVTGHTLWYPSLSISLGSSVVRVFESW